MMLYSFIIPAYNIEAYLPQCLDSILNQSYERWEAIVVDDGSSDDTGMIIDAYQQRDQRFIAVHQNNQGVAAARNMALAIASGNWICFVDGDDCIHSDYLRICNQTICKHKCVNLILFEHIQSKNIQFASFTEITERIIDISSIIPDKVWKKGFWDAIYKKSFLVDNDISFLDSPLGEDLNFFHRCLLKNNQVVYINVVLYWYRVREGSAVHTAMTYNKILGSMRCSINTLRQLLESGKLISSSAWGLLFRTVFEAPAERCMTLSIRIEKHAVFKEWLSLVKVFFQYNIPLTYGIRVKMVCFFKNYFLWILLLGLPLSGRIALCKMRDYFLS